MSGLDGLLDARWVHAIRKVESNGKPNAVRFEPHVYKDRRPDLVLDISRDTSDEIATPIRLRAWSTGLIPYTPGRTHDGKPRRASSSKAETDRTAFQHAYQLDAAAAVESSSFGLYQVLGGHLLKLYGTPALGLQAFDANPTAASEALLVSWLQANPAALAAAKRGDVETWVARFNGSSGASAASYIARFRDALAE